MKMKFAKCRRFLRSEEAPTATEYAVMLALIIAVVFAAVALLGTKVSEKITDAADGW